MSADEIAQDCGFDCAFDMLKHYMTTEDLLDMLHEYLLNDTPTLRDLVGELAYEKHDWVDEDALREAYEDAQYQAWKDERRGL